MEQFLRDLRLGVRTLTGNVGFAATAILTLALGIGTSTALFSVVYGVWLNAYPYAQASEILYPRARSTTGRAHSAIRAGRGPACPCPPLASQSRSARAA